MEKPRKKEINNDVCFEHEPYNQAIDAYDKFLPSEEEIYNYLRRNLAWYISDKYCWELAKALAKRIGK